MAWWNKLFGSERSGRVDYYDEGLALLGEGKFHEALTSLRLALKGASGRSRHPTADRDRVYADRDDRGGS